MANNTETQKPKERVKYKFGQSDIDLTNYIYNLGTNVQSYLNSKNWNDGQKQEFMNTEFTPKQALAMCVLKI